MLDSKEIQHIHVSFFFLLLYNIVVVFVIHWHESAMDIHVFPIPIPPPTSLSTQSLWVFPVHQVRALVSCIQPGLVICFTLDNIHVSIPHVSFLFQTLLPSRLPHNIEQRSMCYIVSSYWLSTLNIAVGTHPFQTP